MEGWKVLLVLIAWPAGAHAHDDECCYLSRVVAVLPYVACVVCWSVRCVGCLDLYLPGWRRFFFGAGRESDQHRRCL